MGRQLQVIDSKMFKLKLLKSNDTTVEIEVFGIQRISSTIEQVNLEMTCKLLGLSKTITRPNNGEIDVLIGQQVASLHPERKKTVGNLLLLHNAFGLVVAGSHPKIKTSNNVALSCTQIRDAIVMNASATIETFFEIEGLGVKCVPQYGSCKCGKCHPGGKEMTLKDEKEYDLIERGLHFNSAEGRWCAKYPWLKSPEQLPYNRCMALGMLKSLERRLHRDKKHAQLYAEQVQDMLDRKVARRITEEELAKYDGPKYFLPHFEVMNATVVLHLNVHL